MWSLLFSNWRLVGAALAGAGVVAALALGLHRLDVYRIEARHRMEMQVQQTALVAQCEADKQITQEVSHDYQTKIDALNRRLADLKRVRPSVCVPVTKPTSGHNAGTGAEPPRSHGLTSDALLDYAAEAERYRLQLIGCQDFIKKTWDQKRPVQ